MKKVLTLFVALTIVSGLMAMPVRLTSPVAPKGKVTMEMGQHGQKIKYQKTTARKAAMAESETVTFADYGFENEEEVYECAVNDFIGITFTDGGTNPTKYYDNGTAVRVYNGGTMTVAGLEGAKITKIELDYSLQKKATLSAKSGTLKDGVWTGNEEEVVFSVATGGHVRFVSLVITYEGGTPVVPTDTVYATIDNVGFELDYSYYEWFEEVYGYVYGGDEQTNYFEADIVFDEYVEDLAGTYTLNDMEDYVVIFDGEEVDVKKIDLVVNEADGVNRTAVAKVLDVNKRLYIYTLNYIVPEKANDTVYVNFTRQATLTRYSDGDYYFYVESKDTLMTLDIYADQIVGTFTMDNIDSYYSGLWVVREVEQDTVYVPYYTISANIEEQSGKYLATVELLGYDTTLYIVRFEAVNPIASRTENLTMTGEFVEDPDYGMWMTEGTTEDETYLLDVYMYADEAIGTWAWEDAYAIQVTQVIGQEEFYYSVYDFQSMTTQMNATGDSIILTTSFLAQSEIDYVQFNITLACPYETSKEDTVYIKSMDGVEAYYYYEEGDGYAGNFWDFYFYTDSEDGAPSMYWMGYDYATSRTAISGTYEGTSWAEYVAQAGDTVGVSEDYYEDAYMVITYNNATKEYTFQGEFIGENGTTYIFDITAPVIAYDVDNAYAEITLKEGDTPGPVGETITIAEAEAIANALGDNEKTNVEYTIIAYVGSMYSDNSFWIVETPGSRSNLQVYKPKFDRTLATGDYVMAVGKLQKFKSSAGKITLEMVDATVTHLPKPSAIIEKMAETSMQKVLLDGQLFIMKNNVLYNTQGQVIKRK